MKTYRGLRDPSCHVRVLSDEAAAVPSAWPRPGGNGARSHREHELAVPRELLGQSSVTFDWGVDGPGTHYLAVAILADLVGPSERNVIKSTLPFMRRFLSRLPKDDFEISDTIFRAFLYASSGGTTPRALPGTTSNSDGAGEPSRNGAKRDESPHHPPRPDGEPS